MMILNTLKGAARLTVCIFALGILLGKTLYDHTRARLTGQPPSEDFRCPYH